MTVNPSDPGPLVIVAEDEELVRLYAAGLLKDAGFEVIDVPDADAALRAIASRPDARVLFTDIQMPGPIDGLELARMVHERWPNVLLLITSGNVAPRRSEIADQGHFLAKPYAGSELLGEIEDLKNEFDERQQRSNSQ